MTTMPAYRLLDWGKTGYEDVEIPVPGVGEVLVRVGGAGLCGSDLHFRHLEPGGWPSAPPWTLGHEIAGWVEALGPGATEFGTGTAVIATGIQSCGRCRACRRGDDNWCPDVMGGRGAGSDGGLAPFVVVPQRQLVALGELDPRIVAPLADAGHTAYAAVTGALAKLTPDSTALVIGVGGVGSFAVQYLKLLSSTRIIATDISQARLDYARQLGAHEALLSGPATAAQVREMTGGRGADVVIDLVGAQQTLVTAVGSASVGGSIVLVGIGAGSTLPVIFGQSPPPGCHLYWNLGGNLAQLAEVIALARRGLLRLDVEAVHFDHIDQALTRLEGGELAARAVVLPNG